VHAYLTGERTGYYVDFGKAQDLVKAINETFVYDGAYSTYRARQHGAPASPHHGDRFVVSIQNHDQVGNRARGDRFGTLLAPSQQRLAAGLLLLGPNLPLLFMGEEYGETRPFPFFCSFLDPQLAEAARRGRQNEFASFGWHGTIPDPQDEFTFESAKLGWSKLEVHWHAGLRQLYRDLLAARRAWPPLRNFRNNHADLLGDSQNPSALLRLVRGGGSLADRPVVVAYFNLTDQRQPLPFDALEDVELLMSSELARFGGERRDLGGASVLLPHEFQVFRRGAWDA
jgi:maltooligosyltrehalose trehalohydrolase